MYFLENSTNVSRIQILLLLFAMLGEKSKSSRNFLIIYSHFLLYDFIDFYILICLSDN